MSSLTNKGKRFSPLDKNGLEVVGRGKGSLHFQKKVLYKNSNCKDMGLDFATSKTQSKCMSVVKSPSLCFARIAKVIPPNVCCRVLQTYVSFISAIKVKWLYNICLSGT